MRNSYANQEAWGSVTRARLALLKVEQKDLAPFAGMTSRNMSNVISGIRRNAVVKERILKGLSELLLLH